MTTITTSKLRTFNFIMAGLHALQGVAVLLLSKEFLLPISGTYLAFNPYSQSLMPTSSLLFDLSLPHLIAGFFVLIFAGASSHCDCVQSSI